MHTGVQRCCYILANERFFCEFGFKFHKSAYMTLTQFSLKSLNVDICEHRIFAYSAQSVFSESKKGNL